MRIVAELRPSLRRAGIFRLISSKRSWKRRRVICFCHRTSDPRLRGSWTAGSSIWNGPSRLVRGLRPSRPRNLIQRSAGLSPLRYLADWLPPLRANTGRSGRKKITLTISAIRALLEPTGTNREWVPERTPSRFASYHLAKHKTRLAWR